MQCLGRMLYFSRSKKCALRSDYPNNIAALSSFVLIRALSGLNMNRSSARKLRLRFSLQRMLVFLVLASALFGVLWQNWWLPWQCQRRAVEQIRSRCGMGGVEFGDFRYEASDNFPFWKRTLASWLGKDSVARVTHAFSEGTGEPIDISCWRSLPSVERVGFDRALIDDLGPIAEFKRLKEFRVYQAGERPPVGKSGLEVLGSCPSLETIRLTSCGFPMNDEVLNSICNAKLLKELTFDPWQCTNLRPLLRLQRLERLEILQYYAPSTTDLTSTGHRFNHLLATPEPIMIWVTVASGVVVAILWRRFA